MKPLNVCRRTDAVPNVVKRQKILRQPVVHRTKVMRIQSIRSLHGASTTVIWS